MDAAGQPEGNRISLDRAPPQPPRQGKSIMAMATDGRGQAESANTSNPAVRTMMKLGAARKALLELSADLPTAAAGIIAFPLLLLARRYTPGTAGAISG